jgi:hypothetical protein
VTPSPSCRPRRRRSPRDRARDRQEAAASDGGRLRHTSLPKERFEVPLAERIAEIRKRKQEERARAKEKLDRRRSVWPRSRSAGARVAPRVRPPRAVHSARFARGSGRCPLRAGGGGPRRGGPRSRRSPLGAGRRPLSCVLA